MPTTSGTTPTGHRGLSGREAAYRLLTEQAARFPDLLPPEPDEAVVDDRERAFAAAIAGTVARRWITLRWILEGVSDRKLAPMQPALQAALLGGAAQVILLDRIPVHAAIDETVEWAKRNVSRGASSLCNAVLRRVSRAVGEGQISGETSDDPASLLHPDFLPMGDGRWRQLAHPLLPEAGAALVGVASSTPRLLFERWIDRFGEAQAASLAMHGLTLPPVILSTRHATAPTLAGLEAHSEAGSHIARHPRDIAAAMQDDPGVWVQDPTSSAALDLARKEPVRVAVDLCAGRGTKTRQLLAMYPDAEVIAADTDEAKLESLRNVLGNPARLTVTTPSEAIARWTGKADLVLLDVPCSNSGVLARRPEAKYRWGEAQTNRLRTTQRDILADGAALLADSGHLIYATCSIDEEENQAQTAWAERTIGLRAEEQRLRLPTGQPGGPASRYSDGGFAARLVRSKAASDGGPRT